MSSPSFLLAYPVCLSAFLSFLPSLMKSWQPSHLCVSDLNFCPSDPVPPSPSALSPPLPIFPSGLLPPCPSVCPPAPPSLSSWPLNPLPVLLPRLLPWRGSLWWVELSEARSAPFSREFSSTLNFQLFSFPYLVCPFIPFSLSLTLLCICVVLSSHSSSFFIFVTIESLVFR